MKMRLVGGTSIVCPLTADVRPVPKTPASASKPAPSLHSARPQKKPRRSGAKVLSEEDCRDARSNGNPHRHHTTVGCTAHGAEKAPPGSGAKSADLNRACP